ncbi:alginate lyase family protein [Flavobacterium sp. RSP15]|nr:alginate lyase family protein [Flavobacterium sp. RSP15]
MGIRYTSYRIRHELEKRMGLLKKKHPVNPQNKCFMSLQDWKKLDIPFIIKERESISFSKNPNGSLKDSVRKILNGEICFFSSEWKNLGLNYDWTTNPETGFKYDGTKHWSEINDFNSANGDIKYVWEKSRFPHVLTIMRYDYHFDDDHSVFVFSEIESWIDANPINQGPNWKCSQEISLRLFNWMYALTFYKNSDALTEELWNKIQNTIYWSLHHVYHHIDFSRIAVRNNHAITETVALTISELLFPYIPETKKWAKEGRKWLEQEVAYQVYEDGTFLQFSMNYHRVLVQLFSLGISVTELHKKPFSEEFYIKAYKSLNFLYQCLQEENGELPNYGANDGALFFSFSNTAFRDYRPQLNTLHRILTKEKLYFDENINEDYNWCQTEINDLKRKQPLKKQVGAMVFQNGGYYCCRTNKSFTFIRCGNHKDRPSHADNLHLDVWIKGNNVLRDSGTYKYNTEKKYQDYFTGSISHNTVLVANNSQMLKGNRFIWYYWSQALNASWTETENDYIFEGTISGFRFINPKCAHTRIIKINKEKQAWEVTDEVAKTEGLIKSQIWHHDDYLWQLNAVTETNEEVTEEQKISYNSQGYGQKKSGKATALLFKDKIKTTLLYKEKDQ